MANSPLLHQDTDLLSIEVFVDGKMLDGEARVYSVEVDKEINRISRAEINLLDGNLAKAEFKLQDQDTFKPGKKVKINLGYHQDTETIFEGIVIKSGVRIRHGQHSIIYAECADEAIKMTIDRQSDFYYNKKDSDIINEIAGNHGLSKQVDATTVTHKEMVQNYATDWDFVVSRAEQNGLVVYTDDNKLYAVEPETGSPEITLTFGTDIIKTNMFFNGPSQLKKVTAYGWEYNEHKWNKSESTEPSTNNHGSLNGKTVAGDFDKQGYEVRHSGPVEAGERKAWAKGKLLKSRMSRIQGTVTCQGTSKPKPNTIVELKDIGKYFKGQAYVSGVRHRAMEGNWTTECKIGTSAEWFSETKPLVQAAAASGLLPGIDGLIIGKVKKIHQDPDSEYRVQVEIPSIDGTKDGLWARMATIYAADKHGYFWYPEIGDEVILGFIQGDPRFPVILGALHSSKHAPPYNPDQQNSIKAFVTKNKLKMIFEDKDKNIIIETPGGQKMTLSDQRNEIILEDSNRNKITMDNKGITLNSCKDVKIHAGAMGKIDIKGDGGIKGRSSMGTVDWQGNNYKAKGVISATFEGGMATFKATGICTISGKMVMIN